MPTAATELVAIDPKAAEVFVGDSEMAALMRATRWSETPLGPVESWSQSLRATIRLLLTSRFPMWLGWGQELTFFYNDAYASSTLGEKHPWALGKPFAVVWSEVYSEVAERVENVLRTGHATWDEKLLLFLERNGYPEETYHTFSYSPVHDDDGVIRGNLCVVTEETERVIGERRLALLKTLAEQLAGATTTEAVTAALGRALASDARDLPFTLTYLRDSESGALALASHTGLPADHALLRSDHAATWFPLEHAIEEGRALQVGLPGQRWPSGPWSTAPSHALATPIAQQGQKAFGVLVSALNPHRPVDDVYRGFVSLLVGQLAAGLANARVHEEERRRAEALAELDRAKTVFFSNVSHELRTPLTLMLGPLDALQQRAELTDDARRELQLMQRNAARLLRLVNTLLDFSRIEAGRAQASYEPTDLARYTIDLVSVFSSAFESAGLALRVDCPPLSAPAYVDPAMWEKIVLNLVSNAFKYTFDGEIAVCVRERAGAFELVVTDTGTGIPEHELPRLFERFHRVEGASGRTHEGTGIGLALIYELVKLHGGSVHVASTLGRGSAFTVVIPKGREHLPSEHVREQPLAQTLPIVSASVVDDALSWLSEGQEPSAPDARRSDASPAGAGQRILLADDNADMREYMRHLLSPFWEVETSRDGAAALEALRRRRPALLVTDVMMPKLDGFGLLEAVRKDPQLRDLPVLMLSARAGEEARLEGLEAGADDYLVKPFTARELIGRVEAQLLRARVHAVEEAHARRLALVFEQAPAAIAILRGPEHVFEVANPAYLELISNRSVVGLPIREALPELVEQGIAALLDQVYASGEPYRSRSLPLVLNRGEGGTPQPCFFDFVYQPLRDEGGAVDGIAAVIYEVTELATARKQAEIANLAKDEFLAMLGHELRNPLMPIMTALELIRQRGEGALQREHRIIERQVSHLVTLVDDLLDVSRITRGKLQLHRARTEIHDVITKAIETASPLLEKLGHRLIVDVPRVGLPVDVDSPRMAQVFANLINNAAKYTERGGEVRIAATREGELTVVRIRDNGIGIAPDMLPRIFELFAQERQAIDRAQGGLGLGLAIVRSLVELHGGSVEAHSEGRGRGAELTVRLATASPAIAADETNAVLRSPSGEPAKRKRILIVDDNEDIAVMIGDLLALWGYDVKIAHDGVAALQTVDTFAPEIAMLDIGLPVMDGYELAKRLSEHPKLASPRLIAVTGYGQEQDRKRAHDAGFFAHLVKPVDLDRLRVLLQQDDVSSAQAEASGP